MQDRLRTLVGDIRASAESISTASSEIATGNLDFSRRTEQQAASLQKASSNMEQLTGTVAHNADSARQVGRLAASASDAAKEIRALIVASGERVDSGAGLVEAAGSTMREIVASIGQVSGEVQLDRMTLEQSTAATESLRGQAGRLAQAVRAFRLDEADGPAVRVQGMAGAEDRATAPAA